MSKFLPNEGVGRGQHANALWRRHVQTISRVANMPAPGHGYGSTAGGQGFDVQQFESFGIGELTYFKNMSGEDMHPMSAVFCDSTSADEDTLSDNADGGPWREYEGYAKVSDLSSRTDTIIGTVLKTVKDGGVGYAITGGYAWTWVDPEGSGNYVDLGTDEEIRSYGEEGDPVKMSACFPRRHCGRGYIVRMIDNATIPHSDGETDIAKLALVYWQAGPSLNRFCPINITASTGDGTGPFTYTTWTETGNDGYSGATSSDCGSAGNILEANLGWHPSSWLDGWKMRAISGGVHARLQYNPGSDNYDVTFSVSPQFYGDCD